MSRYIGRQLKSARADAAADPEEVKRIDVLIQIFLDHLPTAVTMDLNEVQRADFTGTALVRRLETIRARHRLNPLEAASAPASSGDVMRVICSDGLL